MSISNSLTVPARVSAITPNDTTLLTGDVRGIYVGVGGDIKILPAGGGVAVTLKNAQSGSVIPVQVAIVYATGTTATDLVALAG